MTDERRLEIRERAAEWIFQQGVSTVLLCAILGWIAWSVPRQVDAIAATLKEMESSHREERERRDATITGLLQRNRELLLELFRGTGKRSLLEEN